jgi:hypothetical protein
MFTLGQRFAQLLLSQLPCSACSAGTECRPSGSRRGSARTLYTGSSQGWRTGLLNNGIQCTFRITKDSGIAGRRRSLPTSAKLIILGSSRHRFIGYSGATETIIVLHIVL